MLHATSTDYPTMATAHPQRRLRAEDVPDIPVPHDLAGYELVGGELVPIMPSQHQHAWLVLEIASELRAHVRAARAGQVLPDVWCKISLPHDPERLYAPDISFFATARAEAAANRKIFHDPPDLAVEIVSATNERKSTDFQQRIRDYLDAGVRLLWVVYPGARCAMILRPDGSARLVRETEALEGEDVLPGFRIELGPLFAAMPPDQDSSTG
jgi:Uma2 family endonuclease